MTDMTAVHDVTKEIIDLMVIVVTVDPPVTARSRRIYRQKVLT